MSPFPYSSLSLSFTADTDCAQYAHVRLLIDYGRQRGDPLLPPEGSLLFSTTCRSLLPLPFPRARKQLHLSGSLSLSLLLHGHVIYGFFFWFRLRAAWGRSVQIFHTLIGRGRWQIESRPKCLINKLTINRRQLPLRM